MKRAATAAFVLAAGSLPSGQVYPQQFVPTRPAELVVHSAP